MHKTIIQADTPWWRIPFGELVEYRDLLRMLILRDLSTIYKQTILGPLWFFIQPFVMTVVFTIIFGKVARIATGGIPHFIFYMSGTVVWNYFQGVLNHSANCLLSNSGLFSKVYFPRLIIPLSGVFTNLVLLALNAIMFVGFYLYYLSRPGTPMHPGWPLLLLPLLVVHTAMAGLGFGLWVSALTTKYRDLKFALPMILQMWMYATPIVYPSSGVANPLFRAVLFLNPMTAIVEFTRYAVTGLNPIGIEALLLSGLMTILVLASGVVFFNKVQRTFVDTI
jgi:lipopolysaccharide transport system permease protein